VILGGRVMDPETKFDKVSNVGIKDGKIVKITTDNIKGKDMIDATNIFDLRAQSSHRIF